MILALRGKLLYVCSGAFAIGVVWGTISSIPIPYIVLSEFVGLLCILFGACISSDVEIVDSNLSKQKIVFLLLGTICISLPLGELRAALAPHAVPTFLASQLNSQVELTGTIIADPDIREKNQQLIVRFNRTTNILVFASVFSHFEYGEEVRFSGVLTAPAPFNTGNGRSFRYDNFLAKKGVFAIVPKASVKEVAPASGVWNACANMLFQTKHIFVKGLSHALPDPYSELATGLLTGDQHGLGDSLVTILASSGLIWVVVLSGYHITLIASGVLRLFSVLPRKVKYVLASLSIIGIIFATGASAPSIRGSVMACFTLFAEATHRKYDALRALAVTLIAVLLWNPFLLAYDSGFQMSIVVTPALILAVPILEARLLWIKGGLLREIISVSIVAQLACLPLILWQTGELGVWAIPANMLVMSFVPIAMVTTFFAGVVGVGIPILAPVAGLPAFCILYYILVVAKFSARLPFSDVIIPPIPFVAVLGMYALFIFVLYLLTRLRSKSASQLLPSSHSP